jgi:hypothetical protein
MSTRTAQRPASRSTSGARGTSGARPVNAGRSRRAARTPFVLLVVVLLAVGLVALLMLNTSLNEGAFTLQRLQARSDGLRDDIQATQRQVDQAAAPGSLARSARSLGMVPNLSPGFLDLRTGRVLGDPRPAQPFTDDPGPLVGLGTQGATPQTTPTTGAGP